MYYNTESCSEEEQDGIESDLPSEEVFIFTIPSIPF